MKPTNFIYKVISFGILLLPLFLSTSCKKEWLEAKPDKALVVPTTIKDFQALFDNSTNLSGTTAKFNLDQCSFGELGAGDFFLNYDTWSALTYAVERNVHIWAPVIYNGEKKISDWNYPYQRIFYSNIVLEGLEKLTPHTAQEKISWNNVKGTAYFFRAYNHYDIAQAFCKAYDSASANSDIGIPLRLSSDFNEKSARSTVSQTYTQIINDLHEADKLLPVTKPDNTLYKLRPTKTAVNAMLARVFLSMQKYDSALFYSNKCLQQYDTLIVYGNLPSIRNPIPKFNPEVIWNMTLINYTSYDNFTGIVDPELFSLYDDPNDTRIKLFFRTSVGNRIFQGSYYQSAVKFSGLAVDEIYLIRAECYARGGYPIQAMQDLNTLLAKRWKTNTYVDKVEANAEDALLLILKERRKELCFRGLRWTDLRRLNKDSRFQVTLTRDLNGQSYTLPPNDNRYTWPIPDDVIQLSGISQNPR